MIFQKIIQKTSVTGVTIFHPLKLTLQKPTSNKDIGTVEIGAVKRFDTFIEVGGRLFFTGEWSSYFFSFLPCCLSYNNQIPGHGFLSEIG